MVEPVSLICMAAIGMVSKSLVDGAKDGASAVVGGIVGNRADWLFRQVLETTAGPFVEKLRHGQNHDLLKGILSAHQKALSDVVIQCRKRATTAEEKRLAKRLDFLAGEEQKAGTEAAVDFLPIARPLIAGKVNAPFTVLIDTARDGLVSDLESRMGESMPVSFKTIFAATWQQRFRFHLSQLLKSKDGERFEKIFVAGTVSELLGYAVELKGLTLETRDDVKTLLNEVAEVKALVEQGRASPAGRKVEAMGGTLDAFIALARTINQHVREPNHALNELKAALERLAEADSGHGSNLDDRLGRVLQDVQDHRLLGQFDQAAVVTERAYNDLLNEQASLRQSELKLIEAQIDNHVLRQDADSTASWVERRLINIAGGAALDIHDLWSEIEVWHDRGDQKGLNVDLMVAIALSQRAVDMARTIEEKGDSLRWLGLTQSVLGRREGNSKRMRAAVKSYRLALKKLTKQRAPLAWAKTHINLASVLFKLGTRERGGKSLDEAVVACGLALGVLTKTHNREEWLAAQMNLAVTLKVLSERESSVQRLEAAVVAFRKVVGTLMRKHEPRRWASAQMNFANALTRLGERDGGTTHLKEAVLIYARVLKQQNRAHLPLDWAATQANLGNALAILGEREEGIMRLNEAVAAYELALEEASEERVPLERAGIQLNLAETLLSLSERSRSTLLVDRAEKLSLEAHKAASDGRHFPLVIQADEIEARVLDIRSSMNGGR